MPYLLTQIVLSLTAAAIFGVALGLFFGGALARGRMRTVSDPVGGGSKELADKLKAADERFRRQEKALAESRAALDDKEGAFDQMRRRLDHLKHDLDEARAGRAGLEFEAESLKTRLRDAEAGLAAAGTSVEEGRRRVQAAEAQIQQAESRASDVAEEALRLRKRSTELAPVVELHETLRAEHQRLRAAHDELKHEKARLEAELHAERSRSQAAEASRARPGPVIRPETPAQPQPEPTLQMGSMVRSESKTQSRPATHAGVTPIDRKPAMAPELRPEPEPNRNPQRVLTITPVPSAGSAPGSAPPGIDDLTRIRGIGQVLERRLRELGYRTYRDLAALTPDQATELSVKLDGFGNRILRDGWVEQARSLSRD